MAKPPDVAATSPGRRSLWRFGQLLLSPTTHPAVQAVGEPLVCRLVALLFRLCFYYELDVEHVVCSSLALVFNFILHLYLLSW